MIATLNRGSGGGTPTEIPFVITDDAIQGDQGYEFDYNGTWPHGTGVTGWYGLTLSYTGTTNDYVEIAFNGTQIELYTEKRNTHGIMAVSIDGGSETNVDLYSATQLLQQLVFTSSALTQTDHILKVRCTGTKNASSSNYYALVDYVKVFNNQPVTEIPDPVPTYTHFTRKTGTDTGDCTSSDCLTVNYMLTQMGPGDVGFIGNGTYTETSYLIINTGESLHGESTDGTIIKVTSALNHNVTAGAVDQNRCIMQLTAAGSTAQTISYLSLEGNAKLVHGGIYIDGDRNNVTLDNVKISNFDYFGAFVAGAGHTFSNVQIINSAEAHTSFSTGNLMITDSDDFICDNVDISDNLEGYGVKAWGAGAIIEGHQFINSSIIVVQNSPYGGGGVPNIGYELHNCKPRNCLFENNYVDNCVSIVRPTGFANDGIPSIHIKNTTFDMITKGGGNAINTPLENGVHNMEVSDCHFVGGRYAFIVHWNASESGAAVNLRAHHNTFYVVGSVNSPTGIFRSSYAPFNGLYAYNNTVHIPPGSNYHTTFVFTGCCGAGRNSTNVNISNNVIYDQSTADTGVGGANALTRLEGTGGSWASSTFTYNTVVGMSTSMPAGFTVSNTLTNGPSFTGGGGVNPSPFVYDPFYRPAVGSPLLNSGVDVGFGATPDRGRLQD